MAEIIYFNRDIGDEAIETIENYLILKYWTAREPEPEPVDYTLIALQSEVENISNMVGWYDDATTMIVHNKKYGKIRVKQIMIHIILLSYPSIIYYNLNKNPVISGTTSDSIRLPLGNYYYYGGTGYQDFTFFLLLDTGGTTRRRIFN